MIKVFYIEDNNGQYVSADGSKRWTRLTGQALYDFLQTERGKKTYFFVDTDDNGVAIGVEITNKDQQVMLETDKRRRRYVSESQKESGYSVPWEEWSREKHTSGILRLKKAKERYICLRVHTKCYWSAKERSIATGYFRVLNTTDNRPHRVQRIIGTNRY